MSDLFQSLLVNLSTIKHEYRWYVLHGEREPSEKLAEEFRRLSPQARTGAALFQSQPNRHDVLWFGVASAGQDHIGRTIIAHLHVRLPSALAATQFFVGSLLNWWWDQPEQLRDLSERLQELSRLLDGSSSVRGGLSQEDTVDCVIAESIAGLLRNSLIAGNVLEELTAIGSRHRLIRAGHESQIARLTRDRFRDLASVLLAEGADNRNPLAHEFSATPTLPHRARAIVYRSRHKDDLASGTPATVGEDYLSRNLPRGCLVLGDELEIQDWHPPAFASTSVVQRDNSAEIQQASPDTIGKQLQLIGKRLLKFDDSPLLKIVGFFEPPRIKALRLGLAPTQPPDQRIETLREFVPELDRVTDDEVKVLIRALHDDLSPRVKIEIIKVLFKVGRLALERLKDRANDPELTLMIDQANSRTFDQDTA